MPTVQLTGIFDDGTKRGPQVPTNPRRTLRWQRGTTLTVQVELLRISGVPLMASEVVPCVLTLKKRPQIEPALISRVGTPVPGRALNVVQFEIAASETSLLDFGLYSYDIRGYIETTWQTLIGLSPVALEPNDGTQDAPLTAISPVVFYYSLPALIKTFTLLSPSVWELGDTLTDPNFALTYNRTPVTVDLSDGAHIEPLTDPFTSGVLPYSYSKTAINAEQVFTAIATEANAPAFELTTTATWQPRVHWGAANIPGSYSAGFIQGLSDSVLLPSRVYSPGYSASGAKHLYYCIPTVYGGVPGDFTDAYTGFATAMHKAATGVTVTNAFGVAVSYDVWESDVAGLGAVTLKVS